MTCDGIINVHQYTCLNRFLQRCTHVDRLGNIDDVFYLSEKSGGRNKENFDLNSITLN